MNKKEKRPLTLQEKADKFASEYNKLVAKYGVAIDVFPVWVLRDDGFYTLKIERRIVPVKNA